MLDLRPLGVLNGQVSTPLSPFGILLIAPETCRSFSFAKRQNRGRERLSRECFTNVSIAPIAEIRKPPAATYLLTPIFVDEQLHCNFAASGAVLGRMLAQRRSK